MGIFRSAADGRWSGTKFYAYAGLVGRWNNDLNVMAFEDNTQITIKNTDTGVVYWTGTLNSGQIRTEVFGGYTSRGAAYVSVSDKTVAVTVAPFTSYTSSYHMGFYAPDSTGSRIGTDIIAPMLSGAARCKCLPTTTVQRCRSITHAPISSSTPTR